MRTIRDKCLAHRILALLDPPPLGTRALFAAVSGHLCKSAGVKQPNLDRLLALTLHFHYNKSVRRMTVRAELLSLTLMTLLVGIYYQYLPKICSWIYGTSIYDPRCFNNWQARFVVLILLKAVIGGLNTCSCVAFVYQVRKIQRLKVVRCSSSNAIITGLNIALGTASGPKACLHLSTAHRSFKKLYDPLEGGPQGPVFQTFAVADQSAKKCIMIC